MPEAEDVLLEAAHRTGLAVRSMWERETPPESDAVVSFARERRRLDAWMRACFGRAWPLVPADAPPPLRWLGRTLGRRPPWTRGAGASATSDGRNVIVPRDPRVAETGVDAGELRLLATLVLGARLDRGSVTCCPRDPVTRDAFWSIEGALAEARLLCELPGFAARLAHARAAALRLRPAPSRLRPAERPVEALVRRLLVHPAALALADVLAADASVSDVVHLAERIAWAVPSSERAHYRGVAPVAHWGVARPDLCGTRDGAQGALPATGALPRGRTRTLSRRVEAAPPDPAEQDARPGPFVLPFGDPQLSVQDPAGLVRPTDQGDEPDLDALADELSRLERAPRVEAQGSVREVLADDEDRGCARPPAAGPRRDGDHGIAYPEWDFRRGFYRPDHCRVHELEAPPGDEHSAALLQRDRAFVIRQLRRRFEALRPRRLRRPRELEGDVVDLDAWRDDWATLRAGRSPDGRLYTQERPQRRDVVVTLLLDASASTDGPVSGRTRGIDVAKDAVLCFCEALAVLGDPHAVLSFSGRGPSGVSVLRIKEFRERLGPSVRARIAGIEPDGFTRIGAALRHATASLGREKARTRVLLLVSDGKPYDEDAYAGDYGTEDSRQAVIEARRAGIRPFCVNVDRHGSGHLARIFGAHGYTTLWNVEQLPGRLPELYRHLTIGR